jgi:hypothetical protein
MLWVASREWDWKIFQIPFEFSDIYVILYVMTSQILLDFFFLLLRTAPNGTWVEKATNEGPLAIGPELRKENYLTFGSTYIDVSSATNITETSY